MKSKVVFRCILILALSLLMLGMSLLIIKQPPTLAAGNNLEALSPLTCNDPMDFTSPISPAGQYYGQAIPLLEELTTSTVELLPAFAAITDTFQNRFGTFKILKEGDIYYLWIGSFVHRNGLPNNPPSIEQRFESRNGLVWCNRTNTNLTLAGSFRLVWGLSEIIKDSNIYQGWEEYYYEQSAGWGLATRYVTSTDGINWIVVNQPALIGSRFISVVKEGSTYKMWQTPDASPSIYNGSWALRHRTSNNAGTGWGDWQSGATFVTVDGHNIMDTVPAANRVRRLTDGTYQLFYQEGSYIKSATSTNGITFTTQISNLINISQTLPITALSVLALDVVDNIHNKKKQGKIEG
jgi:hypothetical protein